MEKPPKQRPWNTEPLLGGIALVLLLVGCVLVIRPFMSALMWAIILSYTLSPLQRRFTKWFGGRRTLAACLVSLSVTIMFAGPVVFIGMSLAEDGKELAGATRDWFMKAPEEPPGWVAGVPLLGDELGSYWRGFAQDRKRWMSELDEQVKVDPASRSDSEAEALEIDEAIVAEVAETVTQGDLDAAKVSEGSPHVIVWLGNFLSWARTWLLSSAKAVGQGVFQVLFSAFLAFFLLRDAPELSRRLAVTVERLAGKRGQHLIKVAGDTVRGVIFGILGTALVQALAAGLGFWIAGVPGVVLLAVLTFFFAVIPYGPPLIWGPAAIWLFSQDKTGYAVFMLIWGLGVISSVDNFLRPFLISQGSKTPFALVFVGVIGGALAFGLVGVFLGPILLAVVFRLIAEWSDGHVMKSRDSVGDAISELPDSH